MLTGGSTGSSIAVSASSWIRWFWITSRAAHIADVFTEWNNGDLDSYLFEITAELLKQVDAKTGKPLVDVILDEAEQKGTDAGP